MIAFRFALSALLFLAASAMAEAGEHTLNDLVGSWKWSAQRHTASGEPVPGIEEHGWMDVTAAGDGVRFEIHSGFPGTPSQLERIFQVQKTAEGCWVAWGEAARAYGYCRTAGFNFLEIGYTLSGSGVYESLESRFSLRPDGTMRERMQRRSLVNPPHGPRRVMNFYITIDYQRL